MDDSIRTMLQESRPEQAAIDQFARAAAAVVGAENISANRADLLSTCRDYWPVNSIWLLEGAVPALPQLVVWPENREAVSRLLALANAGKIPVIPYGEGSGAPGWNGPDQGRDYARP
jgi:alkyldihydroxyacetonephosphate synthase